MIGSKKDQQENHLWLWRGTNTKDQGTWSTLCYAGGPVSTKSEIQYGSYANDKKSACAGCKKVAAGLANSIVMLVSGSK